MVAHLHTATPIVIVGGGIAGLSIAARLAQAGLPVTVLEASDFGFGASTRNQGWLVSGGWFAPKDPGLAQMCYDSLAQTLAFCPECLEPTCGPMTYLVENGSHETQRWVAAWDESEIPYRPLTSRSLCDRFPLLVAGNGTDAFELPDVAIRPEVLLRRLANVARAAGADLRTGAPVTGLIRCNSAVRGVEIGHGETLPACLVILAGNAKGRFLHAGLGHEAAGSQPEATLVAQKTHLVALQPEISRWPLCVVGAGGFNHLPHPPNSVFGSNRWLPVRHMDDNHVDPAEVQRIWDGVHRLFPSVRREDYAAISWAGTTVEAMHADQIAPGRAPRPTVVDHQRENPAVGNLLSVFPGRASLWYQLAELTHRAVLQKLECIEVLGCVPATPFRVELFSTNGDRT